MTQLTMLAVSRLRPHPDNPRKDLGDLPDLSRRLAREVREHDKTGTGTTQ